MKESLTLDLEQTGISKISVLEFIKNNILVKRFPVSGEIKKGGIYEDVKVIINVSDEFYLGNSEEVMNEGKLNYYFPMGERTDLMGMNSIFGAMQVLYQIYHFNPDWKVLIHCQAGKNSSPTIRSAFYYMMLNEHEPDVCNTDGKLLRNNRLLDNCKQGYLPKLGKMELFLEKCGFAFENSHKFLGGMFDWVMKESGLSEI